MDKGLVSTGKKIHDLALFIFRRDLRLHDNTGLIHALRLSKEVVPCFFFDNKQIDPKKNEYFSNNQVQFMVDSLRDLEEQLQEVSSRLIYFRGETDQVISQAIQSIKPDAVFVNQDVTPFSKKRDAKYEEICKDSKIKFYSFNDITLLRTDQVKLASGQFYKKFTPYYRTAQGFSVPDVQDNNYDNYIDCDEEFKIFLLIACQQLYFQ